MSTIKEYLSNFEELLINYITYKVRYIKKPKFLNDLNPKFTRHYITTPQSHIGRRMMVVLGSGLGSGFGFVGGFRVGGWRGEKKMMNSIYFLLFLFISF